MSLNIAIKGGGTRAGIRSPYRGGHSDSCVCSKCEREREREESHDD